MKIVLWVSSQAAASPDYVTRTVDWPAVPRMGEMVGRLLAVEQAAKDLATAVAPLLDRDVLVPYWSAWEIDTHAGADGEALHATLALAHGKFAALLDDPANT